MRLFANTGVTSSATPRSVLRLALDTSDPLQRARIEAMFEGAYVMTRALQRGVRDACRAYKAAPRERALDPAAVRERLGLSPPAAGATRRT